MEDTLVWKRIGTVVLALSALAVVLAIISNHII